MKNLKVGLLLHWYQPWWQPQEVIEKIIREFYEPALHLIEEMDGFCFTININLSLLNHFEKYRPDLIERLKRAVDSGRLELVGSTAQHPIMPLVPDFVQRAQMEEDLRQKENRFGIKHNCRGFFLPEMAFSKEVIEPLKSFGYRWTVTDDEPFVAHYGKNSVPCNKVISLNGFKVFMRSGYWSNLISSGRYSFADIKAMMECEIPNWTGNSPAYIIIAMDGETFGHHHHHLIDSFLRPMLREWVGHKIIPIESIGKNFLERRVNYLPSGSWSTSVNDVERNNPYPLWGSTSINRYMLWKLVNVALEHFEQAREECLKVTSSCHWWWISRSGWEPEFMKKGAVKAMNIVKEYGTPEEIALVQEPYDKLMKLQKVFVNND